VGRGGGEHGFPKLTMAVHTLHTKQIIRATRQEAWDFFSNPRNLAKITPPELGFEIITPDLVPQVREGMMIAYRVRPLLGLPMTWLSEITLVEPGVRFIDEQRVGPYAVWHHEHEFHDLGDGRIEMEDKATYVLPFAPLGDLAHAWLVRPQLKRIFAYREKAVRELFPG
jgi:ligand-binding SRPBCC domain-containing protein